jgi:glycosyltransferase involved in cell wall biosynthesis
MFNERENIGRTLAALSWAEQIVIIDSFSADETIAIAKAARANITIAQRRFDTWDAVELRSGPNQNAVGPHARCGLPTFPRVKR